MGYLRFSCFVFGRLSLFFFSDMLARSHLVFLTILPRKLFWSLPLLTLEFSREAVEDICLSFPSETSLPLVGSGAVHHIAPPRSEPMSQAGPKGI